MDDPGDFDPVALARSLLRTALVGSLGTVDARGGPFVTLVETASDDDGAPLMLLSRLAAHTANLERDARAGLLLDRREGAGPPLVRPRISLRGQMRRIDREGARTRFLAHHPQAAQYAGFADFGFWRFDIEDCHLVAGFGRITGIDPSSLLDPAAPALAAAQAEIIDHMNREHGDAMALYARHQHGIDAAGWRCAGADSSGMTLVGTAGCVRIDFAGRVESPAALRLRLREMALAARGPSH